MKYIIWQMKKRMNLQTFLYSICFALLVGYWSDKRNGLLVGALGGVPDNGSGALELLCLGKWLFLYAFFFFIICRELIVDERIFGFTVYRFRSFKTWWRMHFCSVLTANAVVYTFVSFLWWTADRINGQSNNKALVIYMIFLLHLSCMAGIILLFDYLTANKLAPCILIITEGILYVLSVRYRIPWLACGMFCRIAFCVDDGFPAVICVVEILVTCLCYLAVPLLSKSSAGREKRWRIL